MLKAGKGATPVLLWVVLKASLKVVTIKNRE
jgi:hypothetical protein